MPYVHVYVCVRRCARVQVMKRGYIYDAYTFSKAYMYYESKLLRGG